MAQDVLTEVKSGVGIITFNRPDHYNTLTLEMIRIIDQAITDWAKDDAVKLVAVRGKGDSFCSGANMKTLYDAMTEPDSTLAQDYFREEYILNRKIHNFSKPYVSLIHGRVRGDGIGLALFGSHRIITERVRLSMSETDIGYVIDGGATYFLSRFPGRTGYYIGLTGIELGAADTLFTGIATHFVKSEKLSGLEENILAGGFTNNAEQELNEIIKPFLESAPPSFLSQHQQTIDYCFAPTTIEEVMTRLAEGDHMWHEQTLNTLKHASPTSLKTTLALIRAGRRLNFDESLQLEYRVSQHIMQRPDFREGIRARVIDKDNFPKWLPDMAEAVNPALIASFFEPLPEGELRLTFEI